VLLYGEDRHISKWCAAQFGQNEDYFEPCRAIGIVKNGNIIAGVIYNNQKETQGTPYMLEMTVASIDKQWATRHNLKALFSFPFIQLRLKRVNTQCDSQNEGLIMFNKRLGFKEEGRHKNAFPTGSDAISFGMLKEDCKWL
jgi:RimJ/RimL family protein N-acetyltransferase